MLIRNSKYVDPFTSKVGVIIFSVHAVIPFGIMGVLVKKRDQLELEKVKKRYQNFYKGVNLRRNKYTFWYFPFFLMRKLLFILVPTFISHRCL